MTTSLTTTSYAILGLLALRPHSAYELATQSRRSLRFTWPTAESRLYAEPRRLVAEGLVESDEEQSGPKRRRTVYRITAEGRQALERWLSSDPAAPRIEIEVMLRVLLADSGTRDDLLTAIDSTRASNRELYDHGLSMLRAYQEGDVAYPERMHLNVLWGWLARDVLLAVDRWCEAAVTEVELWSSTAGLGATDRSQQILEALVSGAPVPAPPDAS